MWDRRGREWHVFSLFGVQRKEPKKRKLRKTYHFKKTYIFVYTEKKVYEIWEEKITFYIPQRTLGTFSPSFILRGKKEHLSISTPQLSLRSSFPSSIGN